MVRALQVAVVAIGMPTLWLSTQQTMAQSAQRAWENPTVIGALKNCLWGQTVTKADDIRRAAALGVNIQGALAAYCGNLSGVQWQCERAGESIEDCIAIVLNYVNAAIDSEMKRAGYAPLHAPGK